MTDRYVAQLTPAQQAAHERIMALTQVYDRAVAIVKAFAVANAVPDFEPAQNLLDEAIGSLEAAIWNNQFILKEPYPWAEEERKEAEWRARRAGMSGHQLVAEPTDA